MESTSKFGFFRAPTDASRRINHSQSQQINKAIRSLRNSLRHIHDYRWFVFNRKPSEEGEILIFKCDIANTRQELEEAKIYLEGFGISSEIKDVASDTPDKVVPELSMTITHEKLLEVAEKINETRMIFSVDFN